MCRNKNHQHVSWQTESAQPEIKIRFWELLLALDTRCSYMRTIIALNPVRICSWGRNFLEICRANCWRRSHFAILMRPCCEFLPTDVATIICQVITLSTCRFQRHCDLSTYASKITTLAHQEATHRIPVVCKQGTPACFLADDICKKCLEDALLHCSS